MIRSFIQGLVDGYTGKFKETYFAGKGLRVCSQPYLQSLGEGDIPDHTPWSKMGVNPDIDNTDEDIWEVGGAYAFMTTAAGLEVISSDTNDTAAGTGVQQIKIHYLTNTFVEKEEIVTLDGTTAVPTSKTDYYRINYVEAYRVGTGGVAAGNIDVRELDDAPIFARIATGYTKSRQAVYTVPAGKRLFIYQVNCGAISGGTNGARFITRAKYSPLDKMRKDFFLPYSEITAENGFTTLFLESPTAFPAGIDIKVSAIGTSASANIIATVGLRGWLENASA